LSAVVVDHLVVAAPTLDAGVRWCEATLGITPGPGGRHPLMSTHNRLFAIGGEHLYSNAYMEIIAIDPEAPPPGRSRWFGLDAIDLSAGPRLIHWVGRCTDLDAALAALRAADVDAGQAIAASRDTPAGPLHWRIAVRADGRLLAGGALPTLIEWGERHPSASMPASGVRLSSLTLRGLGARVRAALVLQGVDATDDPGPAISSTFDTPRGRVIIDSL
jgi:hypothetical protein